MNTETNPRKTKFNLVDVAVILILVLVIAAVAWKVVGAKSNADEEAATLDKSVFDQAPHVVYTVECPNVLASVAEAAKDCEQLQLMTNGKAADGYVTGMTFTPKKEAVLAADGTQTTVEDPTVGTAVFTIEAMVDEKNGIYSAGGQELRVGKGYIVKTYDFEITGYISSLEIPESDDSDTE